MRQTSIVILDIATATSTFSNHYLDQSTPPIKEQDPSLAKDYNLLKSQMMVNIFSCKAIFELGYAHAVFLTAYDYYLPLCLALLKTIV